MCIFIKTLDSDADHSLWEDTVVGSHPWPSTLFRSRFLLLLLLSGHRSHHR